MATFFCCVGERQEVPEEENLRIFFRGGRCESTKEKNGLKRGEDGLKVPFFFRMSKCQELRFFNSFDELELGGVSSKDAEERYK